MPASSIKIEVVLAADYDALRRVADGLHEALGKIVVEGQQIVVTNEKIPAGVFTIIEIGQQALAADYAVLAK